MRVPESSALNLTVMPQFAPGAREEPQVLVRKSSLSEPRPVAIETLVMLRVVLPTLETVTVRNATLPDGTVPKLGYWARC